MKRHGEDGFTLVELLLAVFIFSAVMGGLAVIFATAFRQGMGMIHETTMKASGTISMKSLQNDITMATRLDQPAIDGSGRHVAGMQNYSPDNVVISPTLPVTWFHYCISANANAPCGQPQTQASCLWRYTGIGVALPPVTDANCGSVVTGNTPTMVASWISNVVPAAANYFSRVSPADVAADNQVRINFLLQRPGTLNTPMVRFEVDTAYNSQFSPN